MCLDPSTMLVERTAAAIQAIEMGNNGYADIGSREDVAEAVRGAGYTVIRSTNLHGLPTFKGFTRKAVEALRTEPFASPTYRPIRLNQPGPDYEGAILDRQERQHWNW